MNRKVQRWLPAGMILLGLGLILVFGARACRAAGRMQQIQMGAFSGDTVDSQAIRGWMTIRFVAVTYAVPEEYLFDALDISFAERTADVPLDRLNRRFDFGQSAQGDYPAIVDVVRQAVEAYYANPVAPGLDDIRPWMSVRYVANSTGVPESYLLAALDLPAADAGLPLREVARQRDVAGGERALLTAVHDALTAYQAAEE